VFSRTHPKSTQMMQQYHPTNRNQISGTTQRAGEKKKKKKKNECPSALFNINQLCIANYFSCYSY
jgi:hypothetical protein